MSNQNNKTSFHFPLAILLGEGKLILDTAAAHSEITTRLGATFVADATTLLDNVKAQAVTQKTDKGKSGDLTKTQLDEIHDFQHLVSAARETAKLAFKGQNVKLREAFQVGIHKPHDLQSQLQRGRTVLASMQTTENVPTLTAQGWSAAETTALANSITALENDQTLQQNAMHVALGDTTSRNQQADDLYQRLLTIQNAANLEWPESDPANAPVRADFRLDKFPPKDHGGQHVEPPPPSQTPAK